MITIKARGWHQFLTAFGVLRAAGVEPVAGGGNEMRVPDGTDVAVLRAVAATGAVVHADLTEPAPAEQTSEPAAAETDADTEPDESAAAPGTPTADDETTTATADEPPPTKRPARKATRSRTRKPAEE